MRLSCRLILQLFHRVSLHPQKNRFAHNGTDIKRTSRQRLTSKKKKKKKGDSISPRCSYLPPPLTRRLCAGISQMWKSAAERPPAFNVANKSGHCCY